MKLSDLPGGTKPVAAKPNHHVLEHWPIDRLEPPKYQARTHPAKQIEHIRVSILQFGFLVPILITHNGEIICGAARVEAARAAGYDEVPAIIAEHLTTAQIKAYRLADNKLAQMASWDEAALKLEFEDILTLEPDFSLEITGFGTAETDQIFAIDEPGCSEPDPDDEVEEPVTDEPAVSRVGDMFEIGGHRLMCGNAIDAAHITQLMGTDTSRIVLEDPPYNVPVDGHVSGLGKIKHREFKQASGEMTKKEFEEFLDKTLIVLLAHIAKGGLVYAFMDWRSLNLLMTAGEKAGLKLINLIVWNKTNAGMGSFYRSKHELICLFKIDRHPHVNNIQLGATGRYRTNVWDYPGVNSFGAGRMEQLSAHPTVKPVGMIADIMRDASHRGDIVLDRFCGSGTTLIAAQRTGRQARCMELDPLYVDTAIRRFERRYGIEAVHMATGLTFSELAQKRAVERDNPAPANLDQYTTNGVRIRRRPAKSAA